MRRDLLIFHLMWLSFSVYKLTESVLPGIPFFHAYFEDLLAIPLLLKSALLIIQVVWKSKRHYSISLRDIAMITIGMSVYFEWWLPSVDARFTADALDVVAYFTGAFIFWRWLNASGQPSRVEMI